MTPRIDVQRVLEQLVGPVVDRVPDPLDGFLRRDVLACVVLPEVVEIFPDLHREALAVDHRLP